MGNFLIENAMKKNDKEMVIDLGYIDDKNARAAHQTLIAHGIGKNNFSLECFNRLLCRPPRSKIKKLLATFDEVTEGSHYWQTTHFWARKTTHTD